MPYHRKRTSRHFCAPNFVPFAVDGCTFSHSSIFIARCKWYVTWTGAHSMVPVSASYDCLKFSFLTSSISPLSQKYGVVRRTEHLLAPERCNEISCDNTGCRPVFRSCIYRVWESQTRLFHWQAGNPRSGIPSTTPWKSSSMNLFLIDFLTGPKTSSMS